MSNIRPAVTHDMPGAYRVCLQTGDAGRDATATYGNPDLLGHVYVGPYLVGQPTLAYVVVDNVGVGGYVLAAEDTRAFAAWAEKSWWPMLRRQYPITDGETADDEIIGLLHAPPVAPDDIVTEYPAHLHMDLLPRMQRLGLGRALMETLLVGLRDSGSPGVHLGVGADNHNAMGFYRHLGFEHLPSRNSSEWMGMRFDD